MVYSDSRINVLADSHFGLEQHDPSSYPDIEMYFFKGLKFSLSLSQFAMDLK